DLTNARAALSAQTSLAMGLLRQSAQLSQTAMPAVARDGRLLETTAAVLDFAQPIGRVRLTESCEGNVLLTYFDRSGRLRATPFDAVADSRNSTFEQWLPDA